MHLALDCEQADNCVVEANITTPDGTIQTAEFPVQADRANRTVALDRVVLWDHNRPQLYSLELKLKSNGQVRDVVRGYFGLRKIDVEAAQGADVSAAIRLNGVVRYLRGALYQSYHPEGVYTAGSVETLKGDILAAKNAGFNFLRIHIKIDDPLLLHWADKLGILLMADFPNFGEGGDTKLGRQRFEAMMLGCIERDFNHPSIFAWCLFNETWGFGGQTGFLDALLNSPDPAGLQTLELEEPVTPKPRIPSVAAEPGMTPPQVWVQHMWNWQKLDPTRLVEDMSVCHWDHLEYYLHCDTDVNSWHFYIKDYEKARKHIDKIVRSTFVGRASTTCRAFSTKASPSSTACSAAWALWTAFVLSVVASCS
jgi:hypothetical protein